MHLVSDPTPVVRRDRLLKLADVEHLTALKKTTIYMLMKRGEFPGCVSVTPRSVAWPESDVHQWIQDRIAASRAKD
jgi:prophage regulatory protein